MMKFELSLEDFQLLLISIGFHAGAAHAHENVPLFTRLVTLADTINKNNPRYVPYSLPKEG